jgi:hypothetical protein
MTTGATWVDQARRLLEAFVQGQAASAATPTGAEGGPRSPGHGSDCSWCPLCQAVAVVRGERPEVTAALADVLTATAAALRSFTDSADPPEPAAVPPAEDDGPEGEPPPAVQRIDIA